MFMWIMFGLGVMSGINAAAIYSSYLQNKQDAEDKKNVRNAIKDIELIGSIKYRFEKVTEITERQMELISSTERPSASASHSRHKNSIVGELKALEQEKIAIFKSILSDGVDPQLSIYVDGEPKNIKMSEAVAIYEGNSDTSPAPYIKTESKSPQKNGLRLIQNKENTGERAENRSDPTVPGT